MALRSGLALLVSVLVHLAALLAGAKVALSTASLESHNLVPDSWAGSTFDIDTLLPAAILPKPGGVSEPLISRAAKLPEKSLEPDNTTAAASKTDNSTGPSQAKAAHQASPKPSFPEQNRTKPGRKDALQSSSASSAHVSSPQVSSASQSSGSSGPPASYGAEGRFGVRNLATAFTRAIPIACSGHAVWQELALGPAGSVDVTISVDDEGRIKAAVPKQASVPAHFTVLLERTMILLRAGRFALSHVSSGGGSETLHLELSLSHVEGAANKEVSAGPFALSFEAPSPGHPGKASFTLSSGRRIEVRVAIAN